MIKIALFGVFCVIALFVAYHSHRERDCLFFTAVVVAVNWLLFVMPWLHPAWSVAFIAYDMGFDVSTEDGWAAVDFISIFLIIKRCRDVWWSPLLWIPSLVTLTMLSVAYLNGLEYKEYETVLDAALVIQIAAILIVGGRGGIDYLHDCGSRFCHFFGIEGRNNTPASRSGASR